MQRAYKLLSAILFLLLSPALAMAQDDKIYLHNGQTIVGQILKVDEREVNFVYMKMEKVKCTRYAIEKLEYANGKVQKMTPKITIASKDDWEKVVVLDPDEDVSTLKYQGPVGDLRKPVAPAMLADKEIVKKLKQQAAENGYPFVQVSAKKNIGYTYN